MLTLVQVQFNLLGWLDSNQRPVPYERTALATELHPKMQFPNVFGIDLFAPGLVITTFSQIPKKMNIDHLRSQSWLSVRYCAPLHHGFEIWASGTCGVAADKATCIASTIDGVPFRQEIVCLLLLPYHFVTAFPSDLGALFRLIVIPSSRLGRFTSS